ncbi:hypothetical protein C8J57DRAFT_1537836 [Mycena rebaudengoi]|nr:hypothetical protein C8J57DRAFT_1537836 [Mycena rebaudengoi]
MDVETNCSQQTLLFSPLRRPRTLACSLPALALFPLRSSPTTPTLQLSRFFLLWCVRPAPGCTISVFSQRPSSPKAYSPDAHTRSLHTTAIWLEIQADRSSVVSRH